MRSIAPALSSRQFALLWSGQAVSQIGDGVFTIALAIEAIDLTHSASGLAYILAARTLPAVLLVLVGGVVCDRLSRRIVMLAADVLRGVAVGAIAYLVATHQAAEWQLIVLSVIFGIGDAFFQPASNAIIPDIVEADLLVSASSLSMTSQQFGTSLVGPALGGVVVAAIGISGSFAFDAGTFVVSSGKVGHWLSIVRSRLRSRPGYVVASSAHRLGPAAPTTGASLPSSPLSNRACDSPAHGFPTSFIRQACAVE